MGFQKVEEVLAHVGGKVFSIWREQEVESQPFRHFPKNQFSRFRRWSNFLHKG